MEKVGAFSIPGLESTLGSHILHVPMEVIVRPAHSLLKIVPLLDSL